MGIYSQAKFINYWIFFANSVKYFWKKLFNQIKDSNIVENLKIKLDNFWKVVLKKKCIWNY